MDWTHELLGAGLILVVSGLVFFPIEFWTRRSHPAPELSRKILHLGGMLVCLCIPWLVKSNWTVLGLSLAFGGGLHLAGRTGLLTSVERVRRQSHGSEFYPLAIFLMFVLSAGRPWMYLSALLTFGVADSLAALVGSSRGRIRYEVEHGQKRSLEGSLVFLLTTFVAVLLPLLIMTEIPWVNCLLASLLTSLLVTGFEAISLRGFDNLFVPVGVCVVLDRIVEKPWDDLIVKILVLIALLTAVGLLVWRTRQLNFGAALVFILFTYSAVALADWHWALPPLSGLLLYLAVRLTIPPPPAYQTRVKVVVVVRILIPSLLVLAVANSTGTHTFLQGPYVAGIAAAVCFGLQVYLARRAGGRSKRHPLVAGVGGAVIATAVAVGPWLLQSAPVGSLVGITASCSMLAMINELTLPRRASIEVEDFWTAPRFLLACSATLAIMLLQWLNIIPAWPAAAIGIGA